MLGRLRGNGDSEAANEPAAMDARGGRPKARQRYANTDPQAGAGRGEVRSFRPSQVGVHSIAARRRETKVAEDHHDSHSAWERQMAALKDSLNDEREAATGSPSGFGGAESAAVNAFLVESELLDSLSVGRPRAPISRPSSQASAHGGTSPRFHGGTSHGGTSHGGSAGGGSRASSQQQAVYAARPSMDISPLSARDAGDHRAPGANPRESRSSLPFEDEDALMDAILLEAN